MLIGLTGLYCSGKNHVAALLEKRGFPVLDVDKLGYQALETEKEAIFAKFGADLRKTDGSLDRRLLGKRVFGDPDKLKALEDIVHPQVDRLMEEWIGVRAEKNGDRLRGGSHRAKIINAALLHRSSIFPKLDKIIIVKAPFLTRLLRAKRRDKLPWRAILRRFANQKNFHSQYLSVNAEIYIVKNPNLGICCARGQSSNKCQKLESQIDKFFKEV